MKIPRAIEEYGGGAGAVTYESDLFRVVLWRLNNGKKHRTCIEIKSCCGEEMEFDGKHVFINDSECAEQMNADEILNTFAEIKRTNRNKGLADKAKEIRKALAI